MFSRIKSLNFTRAIAPAVADFNGDGALELFGTLNDGYGNLTIQTLPEEIMTDRVNRDNRVADFDGDGQLDVVFNTYTVAAPDESYVFILYSVNAGGGEFALPNGQAEGVHY